MNGDTSMNNFPLDNKPASRGPMLGTIIIVILIIIGGIYIISSRRNTETIPPGTTPDTGTPTNVIPETAALTDLSAAENDVAGSEADLKSLETEIK